MQLTKTNLKKLIKEAIKDKSHWFVTEDRPGEMHLSFRITPKILQKDSLLIMLEWRTIAPSGMLWDDEQGSHSEEMNLLLVDSMEDLIQQAARRVKAYMRYPRSMTFTNLTW